MNKPYIRTAGILGLCLFVILAGMYTFHGNARPASARVPGKKLPIYCVQSDSPKVAISFDAAWGNVRLC